jgi:hypothetical protein
MNKFEGKSCWVKDLISGEPRLASSLEIINSKSYERTFIVYANTHEEALTKLESYGVKEVMLSDVEILSNHNTTVNGV